MPVCCLSVDTGKKLSPWTDQAFIHGNPEGLGFLSPIHNFSGFGLNFGSDIHLVIGLTLVPEFYPCFSQRPHIPCGGSVGCWMYVRERKSGWGYGASYCMCCWAEPRAGGSGHNSWRGPCPRSPPFPVLPSPGVRGLGHSSPAKCLICREHRSERRVAEGNSKWICSSTFEP